MLSSLMKKKLRNLKRGKVIAVMEDGEAFLGKLEEFDENTIILTEAWEGPSSKIQWETLEDKKDSSRLDDYGFVDWILVNLEETYLRVDHISRIWPWEHVNEYREDEESTKRTPIYARTPAVDVLSEEKW